MHRHIFSAPGKLVIAGEYAVLEGYEALSFSVDRRVSVSIDVNRLTPGLLRYARNDGGVPNVVDCVIDEFQARDLEVPQVDFEIDSSSLHLSSSSSSTKLGAGSSSAVTVALTGALLSELDIDIQSESCFEIALCAHRRFTQSLGSGIDIATSFYGGAVLFKQDGPTSLPVTSSRFPAFPLSLIIPVHTGVAQSTSIFLQSVKSLKSRNPRAYRQAISGIGKSAQRIISSMMYAEPKRETWLELQDSITEHNSWMQALGDFADIEIMTDAHKQIEQIAKRHHGTAKPSGAGGGDISLCFVDNEYQQSFLRELEQSSFLALDLKLCGNGIQSN